MPYVRGKCPYCGKANQHRDSSDGLLLRCKHCGKQYELKVRKTGCAGCLAISLLLIVAVGAFSWFADHTPTQDSQSVRPATQNNHFPDPDDIASESNDRDITGPELYEVDAPAESKNIQDVENLIPATSETKQDKEENKKQVELTDRERKWTDAKGENKVVATLLDFKANYVLLLKADGTKISVPLEKLSDLDQVHVRNWVHRRSLRKLKDAR